MASDFLIIGAGVIGLSTAYELSLSGASVVVIDKGQAGREASWAGAGILSALLPWEYSVSVNRLTSLGADMYPTWIAALEKASAVAVEFELSGMQILPPFDPYLAMKWCAKNEIRAEITPDKNLYMPDLAQVRPPRLILALKQTLLNRGVEIREGVEALGLENQHGRVTGLVTRTGQLYASQYVLTCGAWINNLLNINNIISNLRPVRGQMLLFKRDAGGLKNILYREGKYVVPRRDGHILVGSTVEETGFDNSTTDAARQELRAAGMAMFPPLADLKPIAQWAGLRPGSKDNIPLIDRHPVWENCYINTGHFRYGLTMAPAAAKLLGCCISGVTPPISLAPYSFMGHIKQKNYNSLIIFK
ncbi:MAG: FAD-dependent oxidoreductase [Burkholderiales bacterium]